MSREISADRDGRLTDRGPVLAAFAFTALLVVGSTWAPAPPGVTQGGDAVLIWASVYGSAVAVQSWVLMAASLPGAMVMALVHRRMRGPEATSFLLGGATSVALVAGGAMVRSGLAGHADRLDPDTARVIADISAYWAPLATFPIAIQAMSVLLATRRGDYAPWLGWISAGLAVEQLIESATMFGRGWWVPGGVLNEYLGPALYLVWIVGQGVALSRHPSSAAS